MRMHVLQTKHTPRTLCVFLFLLHLSLVFSQTELMCRDTLDAAAASGNRRAAEGRFGMQLSDCRAMGSSFPWPFDEWSLKCVSVCLLCLRG